MQQIGSTSLLHRRVLAEWSRLRRLPAALERAGTWRLLPLPVADLDDVVDLTLPDRPDAERVLHHLIERAGDDELAARVLLQRLLPDLVRVHRRRRHRQPWHDVDLGDLLTTGWTVIRTYNTDRRPIRLAEALVSDVEYREYRAHRRRIGPGVPTDPAGFDTLVDERRPDAATELATLLVDAQDVIDADDRVLLGHLLSGRTGIEVADELDVTPRTIRNRRDRLAVRLRAAVLAA